LIDDKLLVAKRVINDPTLARGIALRPALLKELAIARRQVLQQEKKTGRKFKIKHHKKRRPTDSVSSSPSSSNSDHRHPTTKMKKHHRKKRSSDRHEYYKPSDSMLDLHHASTKGTIATIPRGFLFQLLNY